MSWYIYILNQLQRVILILVEWHLIFLECLLLNMKTDIISFSLQNAENQDT
jgi:hypothetical protein